MPDRPHRGFTLFEILIAMFIFSMVVATLFSAYRAVFSRTDAINQSIDAYEMANNCLSRMVTDIRSAYIAQSPAYTPPDYDDPPDPFRIRAEDGVSGGGSFPRLRFTSFAHLPLGENMQKGIAEIVYYVQQTDDERYVLRRSDHLPPYPEFKESSGDPLLCENVKSLSFRYYDTEGEAHDTWDSESKKIGYATPKSVAIKIEVGEDSVSLFFETMIEFPVCRKEKE
ncbi:prepilin-type cleavage/methylation domain-contai ning protein [Desulfonema ishimotonii]|uniref:Prepilin-type cleavage/methylation domain-contai ning protein n=1 Tax=Desulfonema ishimotonii TaxID=45657 RepID=A0A401G4F1_9BACT|nr:prepilin-type N-terminal cleavage/methylation domain-containing protein [Desulfonema ishimotonii]GBC64063.1 prepilin-type cleavage/methylation domain-contai ning protein [Desulfonema ishimotonii]